MNNVNHDTISRFAPTFICFFFDNLNAGDYGIRFFKVNQGCKRASCTGATVLCGFLYMQNTTIIQGDLCFLYLDDSTTDKLL